MFVCVVLEKRILDATTVYTDTLSHFLQPCFHMRYAIQIVIQL